MDNLLVGELVSGGGEMTGLEWICLKEWFGALQWIDIVLIVTVLLVFTGYIYLLLKVTQLEFVGGLVGKWKIRFVGSLFGLLVVIYLFYNLYNIQPNGWVEISLLAGLVAATGALAVYAAGQADASVKMAGEMKDARFAALKPIVRIDWITDERGKAISPYFENIGLGPALNVKCYCTHTKSEFESSKQDRSTLAVGEREHVTLVIEEVDSGDWAGFAINCDYQSIYGENFRSILRFKTKQERNLEIQELK